MLAEVIFTCQPYLITVVMREVLQTAIRLENQIIILQTFELKLQLRSMIPLILWYTKG